MPAGHAAGLLASHCLAAGAPSLPPTTRCRIEGISPVGLGLASDGLHAHTPVYIPLCCVPACLALALACFHIAIRYSTPSFATFTRHVVRPYRFQADTNPTGSCQSYTYTDRYRAIERCLVRLHGSAPNMRWTGDVRTIGIPRADKYERTDFDLPYHRLLDPFAPVFFLAP